jgi:hypothetical protein
MAPKRSAGSKAWPAGKALVGAQGRLGDDLGEDDLRQMAEAQVEAVLLHAAVSETTMAALRALRPGMLVILRLSTDFSGEAVTPSEFVARVTPAVEAMTAHGAGVFEVGARPNLQFDGWGRSWRSGYEFGEWFGEVVSRLRRVAPDGRFGFPGLAPGAYVPGQRADALQFLGEAEGAVQRADWIGVNCYWTTPEEMGLLESGRWYEEYRSRYPDQELVITEFGNPRMDVSSDEKARQYADFLRMVRGVTGIGAAFAPPTSTAQGRTSMAWDGTGSTPGAIARALGRRDF